MKIMEAPAADEAGSEIVTKIAFAVVSPTLVMVNVTLFTTPAVRLCELAETSRFVGVLAETG